MEPGERSLCSEHTKCWTYENLLYQSGLGQAMLSFLKVTRLILASIRTPVQWVSVHCSKED
jgi:hypothetical protein